MGFLDVWRAAQARAAAVAAAEKEAALAAAAPAVAEPMTMFVRDEFSCGTELSLTRVLRMLVRRVCA